MRKTQIINSTRAHVLISSLLKHLRSMSVFTVKVNSITGKSEWELQDENYDYHQEIARSAFADMLHDTERNEKYYLGIRLAIERVHSAGKKANVLDIGTGTGLLSMMAAQCGADTIVACEAFQPMAECAQKVIIKNGFADKIHLIPKRSTELTVGEDGDMKQRANILVTEVFDTELIGEGAIGTFSHAHACLLEKNCIVVPASATVYAQVVESELAQKWNKLQPVTDPDTGAVLLETPENIWHCPGAAAVHDIQLSQFPHDKFQTIIEPEPVFRFDWTGRTPFMKERSCIQVAKSQRDGLAQIVFMWWDLQMDMDGHVNLSCAPVWAHPRAEGLEQVDLLPWRDHWMQALYYLPEEVSVKKGEELSLISCHDEYSLWFNLRKDLRINDSHYLRPICECGLHVSYARTRIGALNDPERNSKYVSVLREHITQDSICLCLSEGSLLGPLVAKLGASKVYCVEGSNLPKHILKAYLEHNNLNDKVVILDSVQELNDALEENGKVNKILGEPHFFSALLPWQNLHFWYLKNDAANFISSDAEVIPQRASLWAMAVQFKDLWKIRAPLRSVEGFDMTDFDKLIEHSSYISDSTVEPQPLWEYPCEPLCQPFCVLEFEFKKRITEFQQVDGSISYEGSGTCHGVVMWVDWDLDGNPKHAISTGPKEPPQIKKKVSWDMYTRQGVYFFNPQREVDPGCQLSYSVRFKPFNGDIQFNFDTII